MIGLSARRSTPSLRATTRAAAAIIGGSRVRAGDFNGFLNIDCRDLPDVLADLVEAVRVCWCWDGDNY